MRKNRTALDHLKVKYDKKPIEIIEEAIDKAKNVSLESRKDFILALYYLNMTNRFRENPQYKKTTFEVYIGYRYHLRKGTYQKEKIAFLAHEKHTMVYGPGLVNKIRTECGPLKIDEVFSKISPKDPIEKIEKTIRLYAKPQKAVGEKIKIATPTAVEQTLRSHILELEKLLEEKETQITKLLATVNRLKKEKEGLQDGYSKVADLCTALNPICATL